MVIVGLLDAATQPCPVGQGCAPYFSDHISVRGRYSSLAVINSEYRSRTDAEPERRLKLSLMDADIVDSVLTTLTTITDGKDK